MRSKLRKVETITKRTCLLFRFVSHVIFQHTTLHDVIVFDGSVVDGLPVESDGFHIFVFVRKVIDPYAERLSVGQMEDGLVQLRGSEDIFSRNGAYGIEAKGREHIPC